MKLTKTLISVIAFCTVPAFAFAGGLSSSIAEPALDLSDRNSGLTKTVMCSNVPAQNGSVAGFFIPTIGYFVEESSAPYAVGNQIAGVIPGHLSSKDAADVQDYLNSVGLTNFELEIRRQSDTRIEQRTVLVPVTPEPASKVQVEGPEFEEVTVDVIVRTNGSAPRWCR